MQRIKGGTYNAYDTLIIFFQWNWNGRKEVQQFISFSCLSFPIAYIQPALILFTDGISDIQKEAYHNKPERQY